jgi:predicted ATPase
VRAESVRRGNDILLNRPTLEDQSDPVRLTQTWLEQTVVNQPFRDLASFFASVRNPDRLVSCDNDLFGSDFLKQVTKIPERTQKARLRRIQKMLKVVVPQFEVIEFFRDANNTQQFSDGMLRLINLLWVILDKKGPLLLEEPESSLHPEIVRVLPQLLVRVQRRTGRQIFLSTHSPELLRDEGIGLDEILLFKPTPEGTQVSLANAQSF